MRVLRALVLCGLVGLSSHRALADAVAVNELVNGTEILRVLDPSQYGHGTPADPQVTVHRLRRGSAPFKGYRFSFVAPDGSGSFDFFNDNPLTLLDLTLSISPGGPPNNVPALFDCGVGSDFNFLPFSSCSFIQTGDSNSPTVVLFFGGPGLPPFSHFALELAGFEPDTLITGMATPANVPEPAPMALLLTGMGTLLAGVRLRKGSACGASSFSG